MEEGRGEQRKEEGSSLRSRLMGTPHMHWRNGKCSPHTPARTSTVTIADSQGCLGLLIGRSRQGSTVGTGSRSQRPGAEERQGSMAASIWELGGLRGILYSGSRVQARQ